MTYTKPELVALPNPIAAIQGSCKGSQVHLDLFISENDATVGAYEADE